MRADVPEVDTYRARLPLRVLRRLLRIVSGVAHTVARSGAWSVGLPFQRGSERARAWRIRCFQGWARALCRVARIDIEVVGDPPREPCVLVTNHVGYADVLSLAAVLEAPAFVSMHEIRRWPLVGFMAQRMGTIFLDRRKKRALPAVNAAIEAALRDARVVVLFAEGGNGDGSRVQPFRPSLLDPPARLGTPCAWGVIRYEVLRGDPPPSRSVCWCDEPIWRQAARFLALERVLARIEFGADRVQSSDRKLLAESLHARVSARFVPME